MTSFNGNERSSLPEASRTYRNRVLANGSAAHLRKLAPADCSPPRSKKLTSYDCPTIKDNNGVAGVQDEADTANPAKSE
jgi:hypothetical protein